MHWPADHASAAALSRVVQAALRGRQTLLKTRNAEMEGTGEPRDALACPLIFDNRLHGVVAFDLPHRSQTLQRVAVQQVRAGVIWLETMLILENATATDQRTHLVDLVAAGLDHDYFKMAATEVANELTQRFDCLRVSFGFMRYGRMRVEAMSQSSRIQHNTRLIGAIRDAMTEAIDQRHTIVYPPPDDAPVLITHFHERLATEVHGQIFCTIPLVKNAKSIGALVLERAADQPFEAGMVTQCEQIASLSPVCPKGA